MNKKYYSRNRYKSKKNLITKKNLIFLVIAITLLLVFFYIKYNQRSLVQASYGEIVDGFKTEALIIRDETIVTAPFSGKVVTHHREGERVGYGHKIIDIKTSNKSVSLYNHHCGIISYATDGLERVLNPQSIAKINTDSFTEFKRNYKQLVTGNRVDKGSPVFRIINNYKLYLVIKTNNREADRYHNNELIFIKSEGLNVNMIKGYIINKKTNGEESLIIIKLNRFIEEWLNMRRVKISFIKNIYRGIIIPKQAVFSQPEGDGVLVYTDASNYKFNKVKIKQEYGDKVIVTGLEIGDNVISNPADYNYGRGGMDNAN